jgi:hypothetical protein
VVPELAGGKLVIASQRSKERLRLAWHMATDCLNHDSNEIQQVMFHDIKWICFTICLCIRPELCFTICLWNRAKTKNTICFTICLCISPDLDGNHDMFHDMFVY